jgi:MFS transporter, PAT family, beta-lactamase induction signal transducer AmpG
VSRTVTAPGTTRSRLFLFAGLYFAQGVPWGFFTVAILLRLATLGLGPAALGEITSVAWLPWIAKPLLGPLVDRVSFGRFGRRRPYILLAEAGMALSLLAMSFADPAHGLALFSAFLFVHNLFAAAQDVGTDALAIDILPENERGRANGFMSAGKFAGVLVGGQGMLLIARLAGWRVAYLVAIVLLLVPAWLVLSLRETERQRQPTHLVRDFLRLFSYRLALVAALFAIVVDASDSFLFPLVYPLFTQTLHFSEQQVATLSTIGSAIAALASIAGGALSDRLGRRRILVLACSLGAALNVVYMLAHPLWPSYLFQVAFTVVGGMVGGIVYTGVLALFMDLTHPRLAATHFQVSMALLNMRGVWGGRLGGRVAERVSAPTMFGLGALVEVVPLALLLLLDPRQARRDFADEGTSEPHPAE